MLGKARTEKPLKKINALIKSIQRDGLLGGIGHPEPLKWRKGYSRRIDSKNRLVYDNHDGHSFRILSCKGHYEDE